MCGLNGIFAYGRQAPLLAASELIATRDHMRARGPDSEGIWFSEDRRIALGHRRLSIIDLDSRADQPMISADGRTVIAFNGEIYNYLALRKELSAEGCVFRTTSDTEVLLHLYAKHGRNFVRRLRGMYAFALWDANLRGILLARDPFGIKPLYYADDGNTLRFASQVKALLAGGRLSRAADPAGVVGFHLWGSVPDPFTIYAAIRGLPAGHTLWLPVSDASRAPPPEAQPMRFSSIPAEIARGSRLHVSQTSTPRRVRSAALDSVAAHLLADVDVGLFLSAGELGQTARKAPRRPKTVRAPFGGLRHGSVPAGGRPSPKTEFPLPFPQHWRECGSRPVCLRLHCAPPIS